MSTQLLTQGFIKVELTQKALQQVALQFLTELTPLKSRLGLKVELTQRKAVQQVASQF